MKKIVFLLMLITSLFSQEFVVWMSNDFNKNIEKVIKLALNQVGKDAKIIKYKHYEGLYSLIENPNYYKNETKLVDGLLADKIFRENAFYDVLKINLEKKHITITGVKFNKEENRAFRLELKKDVKNNLSKTLFNMLIFYFKFPVSNYSLKSAKGIPSLIVKDKNINVYYYKNNSVMVTKKIDEDLVEEALKLHLISKKSPYQFCNLISMNVANKVFSEDNEVSLEDYYLPYDFKVGFLIRKYKAINYYKPFKCQSIDGLVKENFENFIYDKLGVDVYKKIDFFPVAAEIKKDNDVSISDEDGKVTSYKNNDKTVKYFNVSDIIGLKNGKPISLLNNYINGEIYFQKTPYIKINNNRKIFVNNKKIDLAFKATYGVYKYGIAIIGGENGNLVRVRNEKIDKYYKGIEGNVLKIKFIDSNNFALITSKGEFAIFNINKNFPIKIFPLLGYSYADFDLNDKYILLVNQNYYFYLLKKEIFLKGIK